MKNVQRSVILERIYSLWMLCSNFHRIVLNGDLRSHAIGSIRLCEYSKDHILVDNLWRLCLKLLMWTIYEYKFVMSCYFWNSWYIVTLQLTGSFKILLFDSRSAAMLGLLSGNPKFYIDKYNKSSSSVCILVILWKAQRGRINEPKWTTSGHMMQRGMYLIPT